MIDGMEILEQTEIMVMSRSDNWWVGLILAIIGLVIFIGCLIYYRINQNDALKSTMTLPFAIGAIVIMFFGTVAASHEEEKPTGRFEYEVILDDTVMVNELCKYYEIVAEKDGVYVLRDKEEIGV